MEYATRVNFVRALGVFSFYTQIPTMSKITLTINHVALGSIAVLGTTFVCAMCSKRFRASFLSHSRNLVRFFVSSSCSAAVPDRSAPIPQTAELPMSQEGGSPGNVVQMLNKSEAPEMPMGTGAAIQKVPIRTVRSLIKSCAEDIDGLISQLKDEIKDLDSYRTAMKKFLGQLLSNYQTVSERKVVLIALSKGYGRDPFFTYLNQVGCWGPDSRKIFVEEVLFKFVKATATTIRESAKLFSPTTGDPCALCERGLEDYAIAMLIDPTDKTFLKFKEELGTLPLNLFEGKLDAILKLRDMAMSFCESLKNGPYALFIPSKNATPSVFPLEISKVLTEYLYDQLPTCKHDHPSGEEMDRRAIVFSAYEKIMVAYNIPVLPHVDATHKLCDEHLTQLWALTQPRVKDGELNQQPAREESATVEPDPSSDAYSIWMRKIRESIDEGFW